MSVASVFITNRTQAVRLPLDMRLPEGVKHVQVRSLGRERIISPLDASWDSFFLNSPAISEDFMNERATQTQSEREAL